MQKVLYSCVIEINFETQSWQLLRWMGFWASLNSTFWEWSVLSPWLIWEKLSLLTLWVSDDVFEWILKISFHWNVVVGSCAVFESFWSLWNFFPYEMLFFFFSNIKTTLDLQRIFLHSMAVEATMSVTQERARHFLVR